MTSHISNMQYMGMTTNTPAALMVNSYSIQKIKMIYIATHFV